MIEEKLINIFLPWSLMGVDRKIISKVFFKNLFHFVVSFPFNLKTKEDNFQ